MPIITCPHCGAIREMLTERLPIKPSTARCPQCFQSFAFTPPAIQLVPAAQTRAAAIIACPHCGLQRNLPGARRPAPQATFSCRRCQQNFRLEEAQQPPLNVLKKPAEPHMIGIGPLLTNSWEQLCSRGWSLLTIYLLASLLIFAPLLLASMRLPELLMDNRRLAWACLLAGMLYGLFGFSWMVTTLLQQLINPQLTMFGSLKRGWNSLGKFIGLLLLLVWVIGGSSLLLVIPGILFTGWFFFSFYILAEDGTGGLAALAKSRQLVRGHWWAVCSRILLLILVAVAVSTLAGRLPLIGATVNFVLTLLLVPFSLLYLQLVYQDLKHCQPMLNGIGPAPQTAAHHWPWLILPSIGWLLMPGLAMFNSQQPLNNLRLTNGPIPRFAELVHTPAPSLEELITEQGNSPPAAIPEPLSAADYDQLLQHPFGAPGPTGISLGPATLEPGQFWTSASAPQLGLQLQIAQLPNLNLSARRAARVFIDRVTDTSGQDRYYRQHSFESTAFQWVNMLSGRNQSDSYTGTRNIYLQPGTEAKQLSSISGRLELTLPLGIETRQLGPADIGRDIQLAGKTLRLEALSDNRIALTFQGNPAELLSIRAFNQQTEPLRDAGVIWQQDGAQVNLQQMFNGEIARVTILMASNSLLRSYPFDISL